MPDFGGGAGLYRPATDSLLIVDSDPNEVVQVDHRSGFRIASFATPFDINHGGLTIDPDTGNLWIGSSSSNSVVEMRTDGTLVRQVDLSQQGISGEISGLAFNTDDQLLVSSNQGVVHVLD